MYESLIKAIEALGEHHAELKSQISTKEYVIEREKKARADAEAEVETLKKEIEEMKRAEIKKALEE